MLSLGISCKTLKSSTSLTSTRNACVQSQSVPLSTSPYILFESPQTYTQLQRSKYTEFSFDDEGPLKQSTSAGNVQHGQGLGAYGELTAQNGFKAVTGGI